VGARGRVGVAAGDGWPLHAAGRLSDGALARADEHLLDLG
jgi:hypothetical protein